MPLVHFSIIFIEVDGEVRVDTIGNAVEDHYPNKENILMRSMMFALALCATVVLASGFATAENKFVTAKKCMMCHKGNAYGVWEKTPHAKAFESLKSAKAEEVAKKKGLKTAAAEAPECLKCHVTNAAAKEEGVSCEGCHGAAEKYLMIHNKKDADSKTKAKDAGLVMNAEDGKTCETCHNQNSPFYKPFKFKEMWPKIEHKLKK
jgi:hypothetical protein